ncbi:MAG TPA: hydrogenase maturation protease [Phycisphaerae bacterium]|nr:hydrogenase maturation protease [Phycisphaerae bacterium]
MTGETYERADICIIGCGRWMRRDDQVGLLTARALQRMGVPETRVITTESPAIDILANLDDVALLILIDAARPDEDHPPGTWRRLKYDEHTFSYRPGVQLDSHALGVDAALEVARATGHLPENIWIYAIAAADCELGTAPTTIVRRSVKDVARGILTDIREWRLSRNRRMPDLTAVS